MATPFLKMAIALVEPHPRRGRDAFRNGQFADLEIIGQADEKEFCERCFREKILAARADSMPAGRKKEEVPRWFMLAAHISQTLAVPPGDRAGARSGSRTREIAGLRLCGRGPGARQCSRRPAPP